MAKFGKIGWFFGLLFGAIFGVLFAPRKGKELRDKIKAERKRGKFGIAPLHDDMRQLGRDIAQMAKEIYQSEAVSGVIEKGRKQFKSIANDLVGSEVDFHKAKIEPIKTKKAAKNKKVRRKKK